MNDALNNMVDGSVQSINIGNSIDLVAYKDRINTLADICKKIMYNGTIELTGVELGDLARAVHQYYISTDEANQILFEDAGQSVERLEEMVDKLEKLGFKIINQRRNKYKYYIKAKRVAPND